MLTLKLIRKSSAGKAVFGTMVLPLEQGEFVADTIENADFLIPAGKYPLRLTCDFLIPAGKYPLRLTWSPRFKKLMPLIDEVPEREGIRIHMGTKPEHSQGCVLVSYLALENLKVLFNQRKKWYDEDEMLIEIREK